VGNFIILCFFLSFLQRFPGAKWFYLKKKKEKTIINPTNRGNYRTGFSKFLYLKIKKKNNIKKIKKIQKKLQKTNKKNKN